MDMSHTGLLSDANPSKSSFCLAANKNSLCLWKPTCVDPMPDLEKTKWERSQNKDKSRRMNFSHQTQVNPETEALTRNAPLVFMTTEWNLAFDSYCGRHFANFGTNPSRCFSASSCRTVLTSSPTDVDCVRNIHTRVRLAPAKISRPGWFCG